MKILAIDDEPLALNGLADEVKKAAPESELRGFTDPSAAIQELAQSAWTPDVALLDIEMPAVSGLALAEHIKEACPRCYIIFVTGYSQYALGALGMHASGYLMKPVVAEDIRRELQNLRIPLCAPALRTKIQTFGNFDIFVDGLPLAFARSRAKEALAYVVSRNGGSVTVSELATILWESREYNRSLQNRTQTIISEMMRSLRQAGAADIIIKKHNCISIDVSKVDCDYFRYLRGDPVAVNAYMGEFMSQYSWAEMITGFLSTTNKK